MLLKDIEVFWMTKQEIDLFGRGFLLGRKCEQINRMSHGGHIVSIGYDTKGDYFFLKDYGLEVKTFSTLNEIETFFEEALVRLRSNQGLLE
jgi:hypothetical protein